MLGRALLWCWSVGLLCLVGIIRPIFPYHTIDISRYILPITYEVFVPRVVYIEYILQLCRMSHVEYITLYAERGRGWGEGGGKGEGRPISM